MRERYDLRILAAVPWKNGGGTTREIVCRPAGADLDAFEWRASVATIAADGAFSAFPGVDRSITLLQGGGVRLRDADDAGFEHRLDVRCAPFAFDGGRALQATLLAGESLDFNVMIRRGRCRADVRVARQETTIQPQARGLVHVAAGAWTISSAAAFTERFDEGQGLWWDGSAPGALHAAPLDTASALLVVTIHAADADELEKH
jgi:environmental stress-induced protein Ves